MATRMLQRRGTALEWSTLNPVLGDGEIGLERDTGIFKIGDGLTAWNSLTAIYVLKSDIDEDLDAAEAAAASLYIPKSVVDAAGDLLIGSADDAVTRLPKGTIGQQLKISSGGVLAWETPAVTDLSGKVDKIGDTMTGDLAIVKTNAAIQVNDELHICGPGSTIAATPKIVRAGEIYDTGNRVYSLSNPPPGGGGSVKVPGYNAFVWLPDPTDQLPLVGGTYWTQAGMTKFIYQTAASGTNASPAGYIGVPRWGFDQTEPGTVILEGYMFKLSVLAGSSLVGLALSWAGETLPLIKQFLGFHMNSGNGDVKAYSYSGSSVNVGTIPGTNGVQRGSTQTAAIPDAAPLYFKIAVTIAGVVTFTLGTTVVYTGNLGLSLYEPLSMMTLIAHQSTVGTNTDMKIGHLAITYA